MRRGPKSHRVVDSHCSSAGPALSPEVLERLWRHGRIAHCVRDRGMAQVVRQPSRIHALSCQSVASAVPEHMNMRVGQLGGLSSSLYHPSNAHTSEWLATFIDEYIGRFRLLFPL